MQRECEREVNMKRRRREGGWSERVVAGNEGREDSPGGHMERRRVRGKGEK